jgi:hypothetical protein
MSRESACLPKSSLTQYYQRKDFGASPFSLSAGSGTSSAEPISRQRRSLPCSTAVDRPSTSQLLRTAPRRAARAPTCRPPGPCGWTSIAEKASPTPPRPKDSMHLTPSLKHHNYHSPSLSGRVVDSMCTGRLSKTSSLTSGASLQLGCAPQPSCLDSTLTRPARGISPASCARLARPTASVNP